MAKRVGLSKRVRFEVLKRDGFRCHYCGTNASTALLHVDHVIAVVDGGTDDAANLVSACADCNLGKSSVPLDESRLEQPSPTEAMRDHADQMRAYLAAVKERQEAAESLSQHVLAHWCSRFGVDSVASNFYAAFSYWIQAVGLEAVLHAVDQTVRAPHALGELARRKYFLAVVRNQRDGTTPEHRATANTRVNTWR